MYLNSVSFGNSAVGTAAASQIYFHKKTSDVDLAQASMLAGPVRGATLYSPFADWKAARARQHEVLTAMVDVGKITQGPAGKAFAGGISPLSHLFQPSHNALSPGFVCYLTP